MVPSRLRGDCAVEKPHGANAFLRDEICNDEVLNGDPIEYVNCSALVEMLSCEPDCTGREVWHRQQTIHHGHCGAIFKFAIGCVFQANHVVCQHGESRRAAHDLCRRVGHGSYGSSSNCIGRHDANVTRHVVATRKNSALIVFTPRRLRCCRRRHQARGVLHSRATATDQFAANR
jgi:hypothetical protein